MAKGNKNMNLSASDISGLIGTITGIIGILISFVEWRESHKGEITISLNPINTTSYRLPGKYLSNKNFDLSYTNVLAMSIRISNTKKEDIQLNNVRVISALSSGDNQAIRISHPFQFKPIAFVTEKGNGLPAVMCPHLAPYYPFPHEIKAGEAEDLQLVFAYNNSRFETIFLFDFGPDQKIVTLKIPSLVDDLHSQKCKLV